MYHLLESDNSGSIIHLFTLKGQPIIMILRRLFPQCKLVASLLMLFWIECIFNDTIESPPSPPVVIDDPAFFDDTIAIADLPWPQAVTIVPPCAVVSDDFKVSELPPSIGTLTLTPSSPLIPAGVTERLIITIPCMKNGDCESPGIRQLRIECDSFTEILSSDTFHGDTFFIDIRFKTAGIHTVTVRLPGDSDTIYGSLSVYVYTSAIPIVEITIKDVDFQKLLDSPYDKVYIPASFTFKNELYPAEMRLHGGTSRDYPKKSFRIDLSRGFTLPDGRNHLIFRAEWNDKSLLRDYLALELLHHGTWLAVPDAEMVHFRINHRYYGCMLNVERIDADFLRKRGLNSTNGSLYEADPDTGCFLPGADLSVLSSKEAYRCAYKLQKGSLEYSDLISLIEQTLQMPEQLFVKQINEIINVNDFLVYFAMMAVIQNHDHIRKNYYLYRNPNQSDNRWTIFPWDLEITFGHLWSEANDVLDESIIIDGPLEFGASNAPVNVLFSRLLSISRYKQRFYEMVNHILSTVFTETFIDNTTSELLCKAKYDIIADQNKRALNSEYLQRIDEIKSFVALRCSFITSQTASMLISR